MKQYNELSAGEIQTYLSKGWLTHDGMWLFNAYTTVGFEKGNELNRKAIRSMAFLEMKRTQEILGFEGKPDNICDLVSIFETTLTLLLPPDLQKSLHVSAEEPSAMLWEWSDGDCFAYKGMKMINMIDSYRCGVVYRIECWLREMGIEYKVEPKIDGCIMHSQGSCRGKFIIAF